MSGPRISHGACVAHLSVHRLFLSLACLWRSASNPTRSVTCLSSFNSTTMPNGPRRSRICSWCADNCCCGSSRANMRRTHNRRRADSRTPVSSIATRRLPIATCSSFLRARRSVSHASQLASPLQRRAVRLAFAILAAAYIRISTTISHFNLSCCSRDIDDRERDHYWI